VIKASADKRIAVVAAGAVTCVGLTWESSCAAIRASLDGFAETHFVDDVSEPLLGAAVPDEALGLQEHSPGAILGGTPKLAAMFVRAATECVRNAGGIQAAKTALLLIGPESTRPGFSLDKLQQCFQACEQAIGHRFHESSQITQIGSPGLAAALEYAQKLLADHDVHAVLVAGVDSLLNVDDVNSGLANGRLLTSQNSDGHIPGEAAACLLLRRQTDLVAQDAQGQPRGAVLLIAGAALGQETQTLDANHASRGQALGAAMRQALAQAGLGAEAVHSRLSDVSAESYFYEEASYAWLRVLRVRSPDGYRFTTPANRVGHVGAAAGVLLLALALDAARKHWAEGPHTLLQLSCAGAPRGAVVATAA
jgi:3-oxoacyl-[acyl-carrier-protein] synthase I